MPIRAFGVAAYVCVAVFSIEQNLSIGSRGQCGCSAIYDWSTAAYHFDLLESADLHAMKPTLDSSLLL